MWVQALWSVAKNKDAPTKLLADILVYIGEYSPKILIIFIVINYKCIIIAIIVCTAQERLLSPLMVIDAISTSLTCTLGDVRNYLCSVLRTENEQTQADTELTQKYRADTLKLRKQIEAIKNSTIIFQGSRCSACHHQLELPSVHFMCQHSYHQQ